MRKQNADVTVFVALSDELLGIRQIPPFSKATSSSTAEKRQYYFDFVDLDGAQRTGVLIYIADMAEKARDAVREAASAFNAKLIVSIGISAALQNEVGIGDVVVATSTQNVISKSKIKDIGDGFDIVLGGGQSHDHSKLAKSIEGVWLTNEPQLSKFSSQVAAREARHLMKLDENGRNKLKTALDARENRKARLAFGPVASGSVVSASGLLKKKILDTNRKLLCFDMETSDVADVGVSAFPGAAFLAIRGISDAGDGAKNALEEETKGAARAIAIENSAQALALLLERVIDFRKLPAKWRGSPKNKEAHERLAPKTKKQPVYPGSYVPNGSINLAEWDDRYAPLARRTQNENWRDAPISSLSSLIAAADVPGTQTVLIHGDAGCGKTTLLNVAQRISASSWDTAPLFLRLDSIRQLPDKEAMDNALEAWCRRARRGAVRVLSLWSMMPVPTSFQPTQSNKLCPQSKTVSSS